ncbi:MAG: hypothetical protein HRU70_04875 [Phycisphaeraceae bacterium]|nr:MAG: hypothetical protein HRU70_04875 [Phycisphaeraceae bacterium]
MATPKASSLLRRPAALALAALAPFPLAYGLYAVIASGVSAPSAVVGIFLSLPTLLESTLLTAGLALIALGLPHRVGRSLHCASCGYQRIEETDRLLSNCPECGRHWRRFGGWRVGKPAGNRARLTKGVLLAAVALSSATFRAALGEWLTAKLPTNILVRHVLYAPPSDTEHTWAAINRRTLTDAQKRWLAEGLLDRRRTSVLDYASAQWLDRRLALNELSAAAKHRYIDELCQFTLEAPDSVTLGQPILVRLSGVYRGPYNGTPDGEAAIALEGLHARFPIPDEEEEAARTDFERRFLQMQATQTQARSERLVSAGRLAQLPVVGSASFIADREGEVTIHARVWVLVAPGISGAVSFNPDGTPATNVSPLHAVRVDLTRRVTVSNPSSTTAPP